MIIHSNSSNVVAVHAQYSTQRLAILIFVLLLNQAAATGRAGSGSAARENKTK